MLGRSERSQEKTRGGGQRSKEGCSWRERASRLPRFPEQQSGRLDFSCGDGSPPVTAPCNFPTSEAWLIAIYPPAFYPMAQL